MEMTAERDVNQLVMVANGRIVGLLTCAALMRAMQMRMAVAQET
jgi:hypothetical protein